MPYITYVLYSWKYEQIYISQTNNLAVRLEKHNARLVRSTKAYVPWILLHFEEFANRSAAIRREKELKSHHGRLFIRNLILTDQYQVQ